jgi:hypothetical protein
VKLTQEQIAHLKALEDAEGRLTPDQVVEDATKKTSPLHDLFEWDRTKAARSWWTATAREIIGSVTLVVTTQTTTIRTPVYVRDPDVNGQGYRTTEALQRDPIQAREALIYTLEVGAGHIRRALDLAGPLGMSGEIDLLLERIVGLQRALKSEAA